MTNELSPRASRDIEIQLKNKEIQRQTLQIKQVIINGMINSKDHQLMIGADKELSNINNMCL